MSHQNEQTEKYTRNIAKIEELSHRLAQVLAKRKPSNPNLTMPGQELFAKAGLSYLHDISSDPAQLFEQQTAFWGESMNVWMEMQKSLLDPSTPNTKPDNSEGQKTPDLHSAQTAYFEAVKQQYELNRTFLSKSVTNIEGLNKTEQQRLNFFVQQLNELLNPSNFLATNPEAITKALETEGQSLVDGMENLVQDLERNDGELLVTLADPNAFSIGKDLATTAGSVVYRNELFELIQYKQSTDKVREIPLVIIPPWINKYYILDLKPANSFIKWVVDQGYTVFVVSWVNPDESHRDVGMDTYVLEGCLKAISVTRKITSANQVNAIGYCIGGTLLAITLAYMNKTHDSSVKSATLFATLTDLEDAGELSVFLSSGVMEGIKQEIVEKGYFPSIHMTRTFSFLRARDLVYGPAVRSYLMGEPPPAFDLLYWNGDATNLPGRMAIEYLDQICRENAFSKDSIKIGDVSVSLKDVKHPLIAIACEADHLVNWKTSYTGIKKMGSRSKKFILAESGHIAGIVNPPRKRKYGYYTNNSFPTDSNDWHQKCEHYVGSWWPYWETWLERRSGRWRSVQTIGCQDYPELANAPGTYVLKKSA